MLESMADFARRMTQHLGREVARSTVTRWAKSKRIVVVDGKVDVEESLKALKITEGNRPDVADRHAEEAAAKARGEKHGASNARDAQVREDRAEAELRLARAKADREEMERDRESGKLLEKETVDFVLDDYASTLRALLENFADRFAPLVFPLQTLEETHALLAEAGEGILAEMAETMRRRTAEAMTA